MNNNTPARPSGIVRPRASSSSRRRVAFSRSVLRALAEDIDSSAHPPALPASTAHTPVNDQPFASSVLTAVNDTRVEMRNINARITREIDVVDAAHDHTTMYLYQRVNLLEREIRRIERNMRVVIDCLAGWNRHVDFGDNAPDVRRLSNAVSDIVRNAIPPRDEIGSVSDTE